MNSSNLHEQARQEHPVGDPTPVFNWLRTIFIVGILTLIVIGSLFYWRIAGTGTTANSSDGIHRPTVNSQQPAS